MDSFASTRASAEDDPHTLLKAYEPKSTGFTPRRIERLTTTRKPTTSLDVESRSIHRGYPIESAHLNDILSHKLWLEAGKGDGPFPERPDTDYNSNVWRNFSKRYGFNPSSNGRTVSAMIASMYPLNIPKPSRIGDYTFDRYMRQGKLFQDEKRLEWAVKRSKTDIQEFRRLRVLSDGRNPYLDEKGNILPPREFKRYSPHKPVGPSEDIVVELMELPSNIRPDIFGRFRKVREDKLVRCKFEQKRNHPQPEKVAKETREGKKEKGSAEFRPPISLDRLPLPHPHRR